MYSIPKLLRKHKISYRTNNIMGSPAESLEDMFQTAQTNRDIKPQGCTVLIYRPFKSTVLGREDFKLGRVDLDKDIGPSIQLDSMMRRDDLKEVVNLQKLFNVAVYMPMGIPIVRQLVKLPRNKAFDVTLLGFLLYQHAVVSGYGLLDDMKLGLRNIGNIFGSSSKGRAKSGLIDTMDIGSDAGI
ncbi:MAG: hypothetical protein ACI841_002724 [Planctomycetota bacterium]